MQSLDKWLSDHREQTIEALTSYIQQYIDEQWQPIFQQNQEELLRLYDTAGEPAYGMYAQKLFRPVQEQLKRAGFSSSPGFPGTLSTSREWGPIENRQRWMWCVIRQGQETPIGTLVVRLFHDHTQFRLPHPPGIFGLEETDPHAIIQAVSQAAGYPESGEE